MKPKIDEARERLKNNDYMIGGLGMINRHYDEKITSGRPTNPIVKISIIKRLFSKIKSLCK